MAVGAAASLAVTGSAGALASAAGAATFAVATVVGPLLGGWLTTAYSWRWAFGINVPLGIIILIGLMLFVVATKAERAQSIDWTGALLSVITSAFLVFGLIEGRTYGWWLATDGLKLGEWE